QTIRKRRAKAEVNASKATSAIRWPHDPADLQDYTPGVEACGRERDEFLDQLTIACHSKLNESHLRVRCSGRGHIDADLRAEVNRRHALLALAEKVQHHSPSSATNSTPPTAEEIRQKTERVNHALLKWLCDRMIPPSAVDCLRWQEFVATLDDNVTTASGTTIAENYVAAEAAYIRQESVKLLSQSDNLTLSFDGGTTRGHESVYTVHATVPTTRDAHLLDGDEASGVSHTAEHLCGILNKHLREVGPENFACIVSDNAGNTRAARTLIEQEYPWIIPLQDASLCATHNVSGGPIAIGNTRFVSHFYAARSVLNCLPLILQLISSEVIDMSSSSPIYWMLDRDTVDRFTAELRQLCTILEPFARSIKCLESSHSTPADVYLFWLAIISRLHELFKKNSTISGAGLPNPVMEDITSILNGRYQEMFQSQSGPVYLAAFFLDVPFRRQLLSFARGLSPFDQRHSSTQSPREYWENLLSLPSSDLLAVVGLLLASIVANSMAEERTMSTITKLNSPDRSCQKVATLIDMATIRQHYKRDEARMSSKPLLLRPTVRFTELTPAAQILTPDCSSEESEDPTNSAYTHTSSQNGVDATTPMGSRHFFEVEREDGVFLASKVLFEALSDHSLAVPKASARSLESPSPEPARKRQRVDIDSIVF
ncbi:hypothetical protein FRC11_008645, partial [Ceratobasidium sp. 423]